MYDVPKQFDGEGAGDRQFFEVGGPNDENAARDERFNGGTSWLAIDEGKLAEGASCFEFCESDAGIGDLAGAFDEDEEFVAIIALADDNFSGVIGALEGDRHDLEHFLVTEVTEEAYLFEGGDFAVCFYGGVAQAWITDFDADIGDAGFPVVFVGEVREKFGCALGFDASIELGEVRRILEVAVEAGRTDDDAVPLTKVELKRVDVGADAHAECADDAFAVRIEGDFVVPLTLCTEKLVHVVVDGELASGVTTQEVDAGIADVGDIGRAVCEIDEVTGGSESFIRWIGFCQKVDVVLGLAQRVA